jgi:hypothetical protein
MLSHDVLARGAWLLTLRLNPGFAIDTTVGLANAASSVLAPFLVSKKGPRKCVHGNGTVASSHRYTTGSPGHVGTRTHAWMHMSNGEEALLIH